MLKLSLVLVPFLLRLTLNEHIFKFQVEFEQKRNDKKYEQRLNYTSKGN